MRRVFLVVYKVYLCALLYVFGGVCYARKIGVKVGSGCRIYTKNFGSEPFLVSIGDRVTLTSGVRLLTHDGSTWLVRSEGVRHQRYAAIEIGDDVFVGVNSIIMPGVTIGSKVVVGAGSVVTKNIESGSVYAGNPAKRLASFDQFEDKIKSQCVLDSELDYSLVYSERVRQAIELSSRKRAQ